MRRFQFSIGSLVAVVVFAAVAIAALRAAAEPWDMALFGLTVATLLVAVLLAIHRAGQRRGFWLGFALFGWTYLLATLVPSIESRLPTTAGLAYLDSQVPDRQALHVTLTTVTSSKGTSNTYYALDARKFAAVNHVNVLATQTPQRVLFWDSLTGRLLSSTGGTSEHFLRIGQSVLVLVMAFVGGNVSRRLAAREAALCPP